MSFNRPIYDSCAYDKDLQQSTGVLSYTMDPNKFYNCNECRAEFGLLGGNNVSRFTGNMVDLESELRGQTRLYTHCPSLKYLPGTIIQGKMTQNCSPLSGTEGLPCGAAKQRREPLKHLPACQLIQYKSKINNTGIDLNYNTAQMCANNNQESLATSFAKSLTPSKKQNKPVLWQGQIGVSQYAKF